jgi:predicted ArsR family transcriptional regulator
MTEPDEPESEPADALDAVSALAEPSRRVLYDFVVGRRDWVSRDEAADAVGLQRGAAAHHLDRLAHDGLLETDYRRLSGRRGPGAGRTAKLYRRSRADFDVSLPSRRYDLAGRLLAEAADSARLAGIPIGDAVDLAARDEGHRISAAIRRRLGRRSSKKARQAAVFEALRTRGFEPETLDDGVTVLHNCPFDLLARQHTDLICGMNLCLLDSLVTNVGSTGLRAQLEPHDDVCCVRLYPDATAARRPNSFHANDRR